MRIEIKSGWMWAMPMEAASATQLEASWQESSSGLTVASKIHTANRSVIALTAITI